MAVSCAKVIGVMLMLTIFFASVLAFFTPYWIVQGSANKGLWTNCENHRCTWLLKHSFTKQDSRPEWYMATQGLMSLGLGLGLIALLIATLSLCCSCHKCNPHPPICGLLACAGLAMGVACIVFGVKANQTWNIKLEWDILTSGRFGWSYWVAVSASILSLLTSGIYGCIGRSSDR